MSQTAIAPPPQLRAAERTAGVTLVPRPTPLTRLHYFDGKFLRASDLELEQRYQRQLVRFANQAGGTGVVHGFDAVWAGGDRLDLGPGLAIDPQGRTLLLLEPARLSIGELIAASRASGSSGGASAGGVRRPGRAVFSDCEPLGADDAGTVVDGGVLYAVTLFHAEALCGTEDVLGKLCADACATSAERPYVLEGVVVRAVPLVLETPLATSSAHALTGRHLRSLVASAYFADEWRRGGSLISAAGLASGAWCLGAAAQGGAGVPVGVVARAGEATLFFDAWTLRRERIEPPPRRYWAGRMAMRPWDVFLAQVLQFQCSLVHCLSDGAPGDDPCRPAHELLRDTSEELARWIAGVQPAEAPEANAPPAVTGRLERLELLRGRLADAAGSFAAAPARRFLLGCGITELPSAGYLPVVPSSALTVNEQVRRMMGEGVDLRFCVVRPDYVAHALEEAQHMERISLLAGLDDPARRPEVDVLVPDGRIAAREAEAAGQGYRVELGLSAGIVAFFERLVAGEEDRAVANAAIDPGEVVGGVRAANRSGGDTVEVRLEPPPVGRAAIALPRLALVLSGAGRGEDLAAGGLAFHLAGRGSEAGFASNSPTIGPGAGAFEPRADSTSAVWLSVEIDRDPFALRLHERAAVSAEVGLTRVTVGGEGNTERRTLELDFHGSLRVTDRAADRTGGSRLAAVAGGRLVVTGRGPAGVPVSRVVRFDEEVIFERAGGGAGAEVTVTLPRLTLPDAGRQSDVLITVRRRWPDPGHARVEGAAASPDATVSKRAATNPAAIPFLALEQRVDADVARADHPSHEAAIAALQRLEKSLAEPGFADPRARRLFPPPAARPDGLEVLATRDWVLFHRRRTRTCGVDVPAVEVETRRYRLFHVALRSRDELESLRKILEAGGSLADFGPKAVGTVEFAGGLASVESSHPAVRDAWDDATPDGAEIAFGALASQGDAVGDGATLAAARLDGLAGVLSPVTPRADDAELEVLPALPPDLPALGHDGAVLYATLAPQVVTSCHTVYLAQENGVAHFLRRAAEEIENNGFRADVLGPAETLELGNAGFPEGETEPLPDALDEIEAKVRAHREETAPDLTLAALTVSAPGTPAEEHAAHRAQGEAIVAALDGLRVMRAVVSGPQTEWPDTGCPALTVLFLDNRDSIESGGDG